MKSILINIFNYLKYILFLMAFGSTLFIIIQMYNRLGKNIIDSMPIFLPYIGLLILYIINMLVRQNNIKNNIFYNITSCLVYTTILIVVYRSFNDNQMILKTGINYSFFDSFISFMKLMLYGLIISNIFLILSRGKIVKVEKELII